MGLGGKTNSCSKQTALVSKKYKKLDPFLIIPLFCIFSKKPTSNVIPIEGDFCAGIMVFVLFVCLFLSEVNGYIVYPNATGSVRSNCETLLFKGLWPVDSYVWDNRNYSIFPVTSLCSVIPTFAAGRLIVYLQTGSTINPLTGQTCTFKDAQYQMAATNRSFPAALIFAIENPTFYTMYSVWSFDLSVRSPPITGCSSYDPSTPYFGGTVTNTALNVGLFGLVATPTAQFTLTPPIVNQIYLNQIQTGSETQFYLFFNMIASLIVLVVCSAKLVEFLHFSGFKLELPQICLLLGLLAGAIGIYLSFVGYFGWRSVPSWFGRVVFFFQLFPIAFAFSVGTFFGFYFIEVAKLTSASLSAVGYFKIPSLIVVGLAWVFVLVLGGLDAAETPGVDTSSSQSRLAFAQFSFIIIALSVQFILVTIGVIVVLVASRGTDKFLSILRVGLTAFLASVSLVSFGIAYGNLFFFCLLFLKVFEQKRSQRCSMSAMQG